MSASVYYVAAHYHKGQQAYAEFYRAALMYLAYVSQDQLPPDLRLVRACGGREGGWEVGSEASTL